MVNWPPEVDATATPAMPAVVSALLSAVAYWASVSPEVTVGAAMVAVAPVAVSPVIVRLVVGSTVAIVLPLTPKS